MQLATFLALVWDLVCILCIMYHLYWLQILGKSLHRAQNQALWLLEERVGGVLS